MHKYPIIAETIIPSKKIRQSELLNCKNTSAKPKIPAPTEAGIPIKKEYITQYFNESPNKSPTAIVNPDREIPGIGATTACSRPINKASA